MSPLHLDSGPGSRNISVGNEKLHAVPIIISCAAAFLLQAMLASNISINGISPNFMLVAIAPVALVSSQRTSVIVGFLLGVLFDMLGSGPVGAMALVMAVVGFVMPMSLKSISTQSFVSWIVVMALTALASFFVYDAVVAIIGYEESFFLSLLYKVLPWTLYTTVVSAIVYPLVKRFMGIRGKSMGSRISL